MGDLSGRLRRHNTRILEEKLNRLDPGGRWSWVLENQVAEDEEERLLIACCLAEQDRAKQLLRSAGFGVSGTPLLDSLREALELIEALGGSRR